MNSQPQFDVLVIGDLFVDLVMSGFTTWPNPGEEAFAERFCREIGGGAAITACGLAKLGSKVDVLGSVGAEDGQWMLERLAACGVATRWVHLSQHQPTAVTVSVSGPRERAFLTYMGANGELPELLRAAATQDRFSHVCHVHLACAPDPTSLSILIEEITRKGCSVSVDAGWHPEWLSNPRVIEALRHVDIFFPNLREASRMTQETDPRRILEVFRTTGFRTVAMKLGVQGAALLSDGSVLFQEPYSVKSVDTTGAGDCFNAGFLSGWLCGDPPQTCLRAGVACGSLSTRSLGGIKGFPSREELDTTICTAK